MSSHLTVINKLDGLLASYDNIILLGDFNVEPDEPGMENSLSVHNVNDLIRKKPVSKTPNNLSCIDFTFYLTLKKFQEHDDFSDRTAGLP